MAAAVSAPAAEWLAWWPAAAPAAAPLSLLWCFGLLESARALGAEYGAGAIALGCVLDGVATLPAALSSALLRPQAATRRAATTETIAGRTRVLCCTDDS